MNTTDHIHAFTRVCLAGCREMIDAGLLAPQVARRLSRRWPAGLVRWAIATLSVDHERLWRWG